MKFMLKEGRPCAQVNSR